MESEAILALEDGTIFKGIAIGKMGTTTGEVVFNTSMIGYQEILTDPSYFKQMITFTYPHIGNTGINDEDNESHRIWACGLIIKSLALQSHHWQARCSLSDFLIEQNIVGIASVDTRRLTHCLREKGALRGCISSEGIETQEAVRLAKESSSLLGADLTSYVSTKVPYRWEKHSYGIQSAGMLSSARHIVVYDCGTKLNILRLLVDRGCKVTVVPVNMTVKDLLALNPHGVVISNGPGDPSACKELIAVIRELQTQNIPLFGICLGFQLIALANEAMTFKMKFGHHGGNHPIVNIHTRRVFITSQNHGFAVDENNFPPALEVTHRSLFDNTLQGFRHRHLPVFALQGHPESSPGPHDMQEFFSEFLTTVRNVEHHYAEAN